jgi:hypothetical protein
LTEDHLTTFHRCIRLNLLSSRRPHPIWATLFAVAVHDTFLYAGCPEGKGQISYYLLRGSVPRRSP